MTEEIIGVDIKTGIVPLGARIEDSDGNRIDEYLTIESLPDGILPEGIIKTRDYALNTTRAESYRAIYEVVKWKDVKISEKL